MMKKSLPFLLLLAFLMPLMASAQGYIKLTGVYDDPHTDYIKSGLYVKNTSSQTIYVKANRIVNNLASGHENYFCWDVCYDETVDLSQDPVAIPAGDSVFNFYLTFSHYGFPGTSTITMRFFDKDDPTKYADHTFEYNMSATGIMDEIDAKRALSAPYPNPAKERTFIDYELPQGSHSAQLKLFNLIGKEVRSYTLTSNKGKATIETRNLVPGMYFIYLILDSEEITSRKLVISK